jgi:hypothetical protein
VPQRGTAYQPRVKPWVRHIPSRCVLKECGIALWDRPSKGASRVRAPRDLVLRALRRLWEGWGFALRAGGCGVRLQGALRPRSRCGQGGAMGCVAMRCGWVAFRSAPTGHGIPAQGETLGTAHTKPMRSEGMRHRSVGQAFEGCVSGAGSAGSCPPRAQEALGRMGFRAARGWVWCSPPRRATAKVPLRPGWCDGVCCNEVWLGGFPECPNGARHTSPG